MKINFKLIIYISLITFSISFKCGFDQKKKPKPQIHPKENTHPNPKYRNLAAHTINIYVDYEVLDSQVTDATNLNNLKGAMDLAINAFKKYLTVSTSDTYSFTASEINGFNADFTSSDVPNLISQSSNWGGDVFLVPVIDSDLPSGVDAAAYPLTLDSNNKRPILGCVCLGSHYDFTKTNYQRYLGMLLLHEISHILAFNDQLFKYFKDVTNPVNTLKIGDITKTYLSTPKVLEYARGHFGCPSLNGVELENQGGEGSAGSHWEARIMLGDYMISTDYPELVVSDITLAVFEDSGWYGVNYLTGGLFKTGKAEGCNFLQKNCIIDEKTNSYLDFCDKTEDEVCSPGLLDRGECYIARYSSVPDIYQYFTDTTLGGYVPADYCPVAMSSASSSGNFYLYSRCDAQGKASFHSGLTEELSTTSFCFQSSLLSTGASAELKTQYGNKLTARCYKVLNCDDATLSYTINIEGADFECEQASKTETYDSITGMDGEFICPPYWRVCGGNPLCNDPFDCATANSKTRLLNTTEYAPQSNNVKQPLAANSHYINILPLMFILYIFIF